MLAIKSISKTAVLVNPREEVRFLRDMRPMGENGILKVFLEFCWFRHCCRLPSKDDGGQKKALWFAG
jgi:hypothetical protein